MGEFSEAHLGSAAAQNGSVGGRGWASRSGPPKVASRSRSWRWLWCLVLGALTGGGRAGPGTTSPALCDRPIGPRDGQWPWVP